MNKIFDMAFSRVYPLYVTKVEKKGRSRAELDQVICWLTGFSASELAKHAEGATTLRAFFEGAHLNANVAQITGVICGARIEEIEDPLMQKIRYMDKLVDELAKGRPMQKILRS